MDGAGKRRPSRCSCEGCALDAAVCSDRTRHRLKSELGERTAVGLFAENEDEPKYRYGVIVRRARAAEA